MVKYTESKKRPVIITFKTEKNKKEIFQNLQKLRRCDENIPPWGWHIKKIAKKTETLKL